MADILIFDIGKTNKKLFVFNDSFEVVHQLSQQMPEIEDEDGFACDDIEVLKQWVVEQTEIVLLDDRFEIKKINFSCYGASLIHLDEQDEILTPLYNYLKDIPLSDFSSLYELYGGVDDFVAQTASPSMGFLNSGLQLYWLKNHREEVFNRLAVTLHFPNYLAFLLHGNKLSEYTSIGCHTALWNFNESGYHDWMKKGMFSSKFPVLAPGSSLFPYNQDETISVGTGLHDSSAALIPYLIGSDERFALLSTGTWSIFINPFSKVVLSKEQLEQDCLSFLTMEGKPVIASRLFFGYNHDEFIKLITKAFNGQDNDFKKVKFDLSIYRKLKDSQQAVFFTNNNGKLESKVELIDFTLVYHQLLYQMVLEQKQKINLIMDDSSGITTIYIDGGFAHNDVFSKMIQQELPQYKWKTSSLAAGSSLGAAIAVNPSKFDSSSFIKTLNIQDI